MLGRLQKKKWKYYALATEALTTRHLGSGDYIEDKKEEAGPDGRKSSQPASAPTID
jgi:hypothetical protein